MKRADRRARSTSQGTITVSWAPAAATTAGRSTSTWSTVERRRAADVHRHRSDARPASANGATVTVKVHAVNKAGAGPSATATARTIDKPARHRPARRAPRATDDQRAVHRQRQRRRRHLHHLGQRRRVASGDGCTSGTVGGLGRATRYTYTVTATQRGRLGHRPGSAGHAGAERHGDLRRPNVLRSDAPNGGIWVYKTPTRNGTSVGDAFNGDQLPGDLPDQRPGDDQRQAVGGKQSNVWIKITFQGQNYIPWAWFTSTAAIASTCPTC